LQLLSPRETAEHDTPDPNIRPRINVQCAFLPWMTFVVLTFSWGMNGVYRKIQNMVMFSSFLLVANIIGIFIQKVKSVSKINLNTQIHIYTATYYFKVFGKSLCFRANKKILKPDTSKAKLPLCLIQHNAKIYYGGVEVFNSFLIMALQDGEWPDPNNYQPVKNSELITLTVYNLIICFLLYS